MKARAFVWGMVAVLVAATALRLLAFGEVPPGLYHDEAYHGLDAAGVLEGRLPVYFPANNGREPLLIYLIALAVGLLGRSPFSLRLPAFFVGVLTVAATGAAGRALFSRRVGVFAAAVLAVMLWHVHLSRVGFRAVLVPLLIALVAWQTALGVRVGRWRHWLAAGLLYGLSFYTYTAVRFTPVALVAIGLYALLTCSVARAPRSSAGSRLWRGIGLSVLAAIVVMGPLAIYTITAPHVVLGRLGQVSISNPQVHHGDFLGMLGAQALSTLGMFFVRGDRIWRHNVPWRPVFDPVLGAAFVWGLLVAIRRLRRNPAAGLVLIWTAVMSLPTLLAEDAPHFLRAVGVLPMVVFLPALGLNWLVARLRVPSLGLAMVTLTLLFGLGCTAVDYFGAYARAPMVGYWFEDGAVTLAGRVNSFLGKGWDGERMIHGQPGARRVFLDRRLWAEWPQVRFLVATPDAVTLGLEGRRSGGPPGSPVAIFAWPYEGWRQAWLLLPEPAEVTVEEGPFSQGDRDVEPYTTYVAFFAAPPDPAPVAMARFSEGVELLGVSVMPVEGPGVSRVGGGVRVRLRWRATAPLSDDFTVFLHYLRDGERIAQADGHAAGGYFPTSNWRRGDIINDDHYLVEVETLHPGRDGLLFGLWQPESGARLYLLDAASNPTADWITLPVDG